MQSPQQLAKELTQFCQRTALETWTLANSPQGKAILMVAVLISIALTGDDGGGDKQGKWQSHD